MAELFEPVTVGAMRLRHRAVMAPLTRMRAGSSHLPNVLMKEYYHQRASDGGLIITEAAAVARRGYGVLNAPGIHDEVQVAGWRAITDAVHARGGSIALQLWHAGRRAHPDVQPGGVAPVGPSAVGIEDDPSRPTPRVLGSHEILDIVAEYRAAAERARRAGFDAVEIHAASGYLPEQFLREDTNRRDDAYGGTIANRARFLLEVTEAAIQEFGSDRVGVRIGPHGTATSMSDGAVAATFGHVADRLNDMRIAWLHVIAPRTDTARAPDGTGLDLFKGVFRHGAVIAANGFDATSAREVLAAGAADLVAFGRLFIANPDLPKRLRDGLPLNPYDRSTFYGGDARGYTDYPVHGAEPRPAS